MADKKDYDEKALNIWDELTRVASKREKITYKKLGIKTGIPYHYFTKPLNLIQLFCQKEQLPPLTILVVRSGSNKPGNGLWTDPSEIPQKTLEVQQFNWTKIKKPESFLLVEV